MKHGILLKILVLLVINESVCLGQQHVRFQENGLGTQSLQYLRNVLHTIDPRLTRF